MQRHLPLLARDDFLHYLDTVTTEEALFSRLTYWMVFRGLPTEQNEKYELVRQRALELKLWNGLDLKMERWKEAIPAEYKSMGDEAFSAQIGQDYADYINGTPSQQGKAKPLAALHVQATFRNDPATYSICGRWRDTYGHGAVSGETENRQKLGWCLTCAYLWPLECPFWAFRRGSMAHCTLP